MTPPHQGAAHSDDRLMGWSTRQAPASERDSSAMWWLSSVPGHQARARLAETTFPLTPSLSSLAPLPPSQASPSTNHLHQNPCLRLHIQRACLTEATRTLCCQEDSADGTPPCSSQPTANLLPGWSIRTWSLFPRAARLWHLKKSGFTDREQPSLAMETCGHTDEHDAKGKKPVAGDHMSCDSIHRKCTENTNL